MVDPDYRSVRSSLQRSDKVAGTSRGRRRRPLSRQARRPPNLQIAPIPSRPQPRPFEPRLPVIATPERIDQRPNRQPVPIPRTGFHPVRPMLEIPAKVLDLPLPRPDLPTAPYHCSRPLGANDMLADRRRIETRHAPREKLTGLLGCHLLIRRPRHYRADPT